MFHIFKNGKEYVIPILTWVDYNGKLNVPIEDHLVLVTLDDKTVTVAKYYKDKGFGKKLDKHVVAWRELPDPYMNDEEVRDMLNKYVKGE